MDSLEAWRPARADVDSVYNCASDKETLPEVSSCLAVQGTVPMASPSISGQVCQK